jgi:hypothetical protein
MGKYLVWALACTCVSSVASLEFLSPTISGPEVELGTNFDISWKGASSPVTLELRGWYALKNPWPNRMYVQSTKNTHFEKAYCADKRS